jgi:hypothetical protein
VLERQATDRSIVPQPGQMLGALGSEQRDATEVR